MNIYPDKFNSSNINFSVNVKVSKAVQFPPKIHELKLLEDDIIIDQFVMSTKSQ